ncbi:MAG: hypothetical protein Q4C59_14775 [Lachnospiraceae bacterium]|nr:hypothetical protein [Lachnospiraceae bacterium]
MMIKAEKKMLDFVQKNSSVLFLLAVLVIGCCMRIAGFHFLSNDAKKYLLKWYDKIAVEGISKQVGNYNIPYQIIIYILTKLPLKPLHAYKVLSCAFDLGMACLGGLMVWALSEKEKVFRGIMAFTLVFCSPIVILNSAVWAQCDSIYTFFGIAALLLLFLEKYGLSFVCLGLAFAFKLQTAFLVPFFLICYVCRKKFSILNFLLIPVTMVVMSLPGLLAGRSVMDILKIYTVQTNTYNKVYMNFPNIYTLITDVDGSGHYPMFRKLAILMTILLLGCGLYICLSKGTRLLSAKVFWGVVIWSLYTCNLFLPNMHERYAYVLEVISILYCFITPVSVPLAVVVNLLPVFTYGSYLFKYRAVPITVSSLISLAVYVAFSCWLYSRLQENREK